MAARRGMTALRGQLARAEIYAGAQVFLIGRDAHGRAHAGALVETQRPGEVLRIHAQTDLALAAAPELGEGVVQQRRTQPALAPGPPHREGVEPALIGILTAEGDAGDPVGIGPVRGEGPERGGEDAAL